MSLRVGIDIGGTFTDLVAIAADGRVLTRKAASTPHDYGEGIVIGLASLLAEAEVPVADVLHATTIGSNTILEGRGARTALITTRGFRDALEIRDLRMPRLYDMHWTKPPALVERRLRLEVTEKTRPDGTIAIELDHDSVAAAIAMLRAERAESLAICLLHSYANPLHENLWPMRCARHCPHCRSRSATRSCPRSANTRAPAPPSSTPMSSPSSAPT
jgi:N-methylhydantoinase A